MVHLTSDFTMTEISRDFSKSYKGLLCYVACFDRIQLGSEMVEAKRHYLQGADYVIRNVLFFISQICLNFVANKSNIRQDIYKC